MVRNGVPQRHEVAACRIPLTLFERGGEAFTFARVEGEQSAGLQQWWQILKQVLDGHEVTAAAASPLEPGGAEGL